MGQKYCININEGSSVYGFIYELVSTQGETATILDDITPGADEVDIPLEDILEITKEEYEFIMEAIDTEDDDLCDKRIAQVIDKYFE